MLEKAATTILREPTQIITDTKGHHTLRLDGQFEDCDESEEEAVFVDGPVPLTHAMLHILVCESKGVCVVKTMHETMRALFFRRMKIVRNWDKLLRTCRRSTLRQLRLLQYLCPPKRGRLKCDMCCHKDILQQAFG